MGTWLLVLAMIRGMGGGVWVETQSLQVTRLHVPLEPQSQVSFLVAIPEGSSPEVRMLTPDPGIQVNVGETAKMRDFWVVPITVLTTDRLRTEEAVMEVLHPGGAYPQAYTPSFEGLYRKVIVNFSSLSLLPRAPMVLEYPQGARYLIIAPDDFVEVLEPLAAWKTQKGMLAKIVPLSVAGPTATHIKNYIQNAYDTWEVPPEYVLLAGNAQRIPFTGTDNFYVTVDGADPLIDIFIGRFPAGTSYEIATMVAKTLAYETLDSIWPDTLWFQKATIIVRNDYDADDSIYYADAQVAQTYLLNEGYTQVDLFDRVHGNTASDVILSVNDGRSIVFYRGQGVGNWWPPFEVNPAVLQNGWRLPIVISTTCATIDPYGGITQANSGLRWGVRPIPRARWGSLARRPSGVTWPISGVRWPRASSMRPSIPPMSQL